MLPSLKFKEKNDAKYIYTINKIELCLIASSVVLLREMICWIPPHWGQANQNQQLRLTYPINVILIDRVDTQ